MLSRRVYRNQTFMLKFVVYKIQKYFQNNLIYFTISDDSSKAIFPVAFLRSSFGMGALSII